MLFIYGGDMNQFKGISYKNEQFEVKDSTARKGLEKIQQINYELRVLSDRVEEIGVEYDENNENLIFL